MALNWYGFTIYEPYGEDFLQAHSVEDALAILRFNLVRNMRASDPGAYRDRTDAQVLASCYPIRTLRCVEAPPEGWKPTYWSKCAKLQ